MDGMTPSDPIHLNADTSEASRRVSGGVRSPSVRWILAVTIIAAVGVDQITKMFAVEALRSGPAHFGVLHLRLVANRGLLMGMVPAPIVGVAAATLLVVLVAVLAARKTGTRSSIAYGLLAGGALGNFVDRLLERQQFPANAVVDWVSFGGMTFNLADVALLTGALVLLATPKSAIEQPPPDESPPRPPADATERTLWDSSNRGDHWRAS